MKVTNFQGKGKVPVDRRKKFNKIDVNKEAQFLLTAGEFPSLLYTSLKIKLKESIGYVTSKTTNKKKTEGRGRKEEPRNVEC